jgi:hypothetical protein
MRPHEVISRPVYRNGVFYPHASFGPPRRKPRPSHRIFRGMLVALAFDFILLVIAWVIFELIRRVGGI